MIKDYMQGIYTEAQRCKITGEVTPYHRPVCLVRKCKCTPDYGIIREWFHGIHDGLNEFAERERQRRFEIKKELLN